MVHRGREAFLASIEGVRGGGVEGGDVWEGDRSADAGKGAGGSGAYAKRSSNVVVKGRLATASPSERSEL